MPVTFLTGASSGIGRSLARRLAADGDSLAVVARRAELLDTLVAEIEALGGCAMAIPCDVTDGPAVARAVAEAEARFGPVERLVANAGGGEPTFVDSFRAAQILETVELNLGGAIHCIEAVLPGMLGRRSGHIVVTSSLAACRGLPGAAAYSAAKAALTSLIESLRVDLRSRGIDVTLLVPGFVRTKDQPRRQGARPRPLQLDLEEATRRMHRAIRSRRGRHAFPAGLALAASLVRLLPAGLVDRMLSGRGPTPKPQI